MIIHRARGMAILGLIILLGAGLRIPGLADRSFWYDEMVLWLYSLGENPYILHAPHEAPLMALLGKGLMMLFGTTSVTLLHGLSLLIGILLIPACYALARELSGSRTAGLAAALLTAVSPYAISESLEARPYGLFMLTSALFYRALLHAFNRDSIKAWMLYALAASVLCLSHMGASHVLIASGLWVIAVSIARKPPALARRVFFLRWLGATAIGVLVGGTWILLRHLEGPTYQRDLFYAIEGHYPYGVSNFLRMVFINAGSGPVASYHAATWSMADLGGLLFVGLFIAGIFALCGRKRKPCALLVVMGLAVPMSMMYLTSSKLVGTFPGLRYLAHILTLFLSGTAAAVLLRPTVKPVRAIAAVLIATAVMSSLAGTRSTPPNTPESMRYAEQAQWIDDHADELNGVIILSYLQHIGPADIRLSNIYHYHRRNTLPLLHCTDQQMYEPRFIPTGIDHRTYVRGSTNHPAHLVAGKYAVLSRKDPDPSLFDELTNRYSITPAQALPVPPGLTLWSISTLQQSHKP